MKQTWRWFGSHDLVSVEDMLQAGVEGVVSALHHVPTGMVWTKDEIEKRQHEIATMRDGSPSGLQWEVAESLPVSENIKKQKGNWRDHIANYKISLGHLAASGVKTVCYNFMPVLDWTRTDLHWQLANGATCMRFDFIDFAVFDIFILKRTNAVNEFPQEITLEAEKRFATMNAQTKKALTRNIICGLPGAAEHFTLEDVRHHIGEYDSISAQQLRVHLITFLEEVVPIAEKLGIQMCGHPDDPPFGLLGLPRIMSTEEDYRKIINAVDSNANGVTLCSGSLGARADNDLPGMMDRLGDRVHFLHMRNVKRETSIVRGSFHEASHLEGDTDMVALIAAVLKQEHKRRKAGRSDHSIPMRPDHGQDILDDLDRAAQPGYPMMGRLKGLAELRGISTALAHPDYGQRK